MTPTNELRFVERTVSVPVDNSGFIKHIDEIGNTVITRKQTIRVLQQKWVNVEVSPARVQWRDVPLVKEEA